jgi:hypothetical protein
MSQFFTSVTASNLPPTVVETITGNSGGPESAVANNFNIVTANSTVKFVGTAGTETLDFGISNLILGSDPSASITSASFNTGLGDFVFGSLTSGGENTAIGTGAGNSITTSINCTLIGFGSGDAITTSQQNTGCGAASLGELISGSGDNTAIGANSLSTLKTGAQNTCIGFNSGSAYSTSESGNILIGSSVNGTALESNVIRIGNTQTNCFISGIHSVTIPGSPVSVSTTGELGDLGFGVANLVLTSNGPGISPTWKAVSGSILVNVTAPGAYPYTTLATDDVIIVDTSAARTIIPMVGPATGQTYRIKDNVGSAAANNITITPSGNNIDGAASYVINNNYGSIDIVYNGTQWNKF